jgi:tetratricopeptide (TPR) repeat protein
LFVIQSTRVKRARAKYELALKIVEVANGPDHLHIAVYVCNLGLVLQELGDFAGARANYERAQKIFEKFLGDDHPSTRRVQRNLDALTIEENKQKNSR